MHNYDFGRHEWRYDIGGWAWVNTELMPDMLLWYSFLRTGRADLYRFAEAMTRHTSEVDVHHTGPFAPLGSRHNVNHWGDGAKQPRASHAGLKRQLYFLSGGDERLGDLLREQVDADLAYEYLVQFNGAHYVPTDDAGNYQLDRRASGPAPRPEDFGPRPKAADRKPFTRFGLEWMCYALNWTTEWERDPLKLKVAAYYFNRAAAWGKPVSFATKSDAYLAGSIRDYERQGRAPTTLQDQVFQVDDSVHQRWGFLEDAQYWDVGTIVYRLVENVCRNGNLLLNFSPKADGTIPPEQVKLLLGIGAWLDVNGDAIYGTRPWTQAGEGVLTPARGQRDAPADIRFTKKDDAIYAILLAWPQNGEVRVMALGDPAGKVASVELLGSGPVAFHQDAAGLHVKLPAAKPCDYAYALKIGGLK